MIYTSPEKAFEPARFESRVKINYTIIIPHKNTPDLLQRCLDSIPKRADIQIIVVDDNSDPGKIDFNNFPGKNEKNIEIIFSKEGKGAGHARNLGLKHCEGKWILFADSDDFFTTNFLLILDRYKDLNFDILFFNVIAIINDTFEPSKRVSKLNEYIERAYDNTCADAINDLKYKVNAPWYKMYSRKFISDFNLNFAEVIKGNDMFFTFCASYFCRNYHIEKLPVYTTVERENSMTYQTYSYEVIEEMLRNTIKRNYFFKFINHPEWNYSILKFFLKILLREGPLNFCRIIWYYFFRLEKTIKYEFVNEIQKRMY
ncbi:glycosyltransferase family 2 protein [Mangrovibacterium lignilyticum]|uniref:glycosyltransferase family 2 protein n=1 Tax=Mangrovibacterium lignilyticum TaxID=2668052 RepID=UPI0013D44468|nr:glycosyltransferase family 2 protein [Mangrovibacterium lignilyticum]